MKAPSSLFNRSQTLIPDVIACEREAVTFTPLLPIYSWVDWDKPHIKCLAQGHTLPPAAGLEPTTYV